MASAPLRTLRLRKKTWTARQLNDERSTAGQKGFTVSVQSADRTFWGFWRGVVR